MSVLLIHMNVRLAQTKQSRPSALYKIIKEPLILENKGHLVPFMVRMACQTSNKNATPNSRLRSLEPMSGFLH